MCIHSRHHDGHDKQHFWQLFGKMYENVIKVFCHLDYDIRPGSGRLDQGVYDPNRGCGVYQLRKCNFVLDVNSFTINFRRLLNSYDIVLLIVAWIPSMKFSLFHVPSRVITMDTASSSFELMY